MKRIAIAAVLSSTLLVAVSPAQQRASTPPPKGWIGVDMQKGRDDAGITLEYPVIVSVQPNSPADNAKLTVGDTVLKFGDLDAHEHPSGLTRLLQPGRRIRLKLQHNGVRTVTVVARQHPALFLFNVDKGDGSSGGGGVGFFVQGLTPIAAPTAMRITTIIAGAILAQMNTGLAEALHAQDQGVLVLEVAPATPAMRAGLKGGDIIVKADTVRVTKPATILVAMSSKTTHDSADRRIALNVVRMGKERKITLSW